MHDLHQRMHACVGAARAQGTHRLGGEPAQGQFELILDGFTRKLALPAFIGAAAVADAERHSHRHHLTGKTTAFKLLSRQRVQERLCFGFQRTLGFGDNLIGQRPGAIGVAQGVEFLGQHELDFKRVFF